MNNQQSSGAARDILKGAIIGAAVATTVAVLLNKDTREKVTKGMKDAMNEMKRRSNEMKKETKEMDKTSQRMEERFPKKEEQEM